MTQEHTDIEPLLDVNQVAEILGTTPAGVHEARRRGTPPATLAFKIGRSLRWDPREVRAYIESAKAEREDLSAGAT